jgi:hypothetical protein
VANVPHLAELSRTYAGRVTFLGATSPDRSGNTLEAVERFIAAKRERLPYRVAWLPESTGPAGEAGIPFNPWFRQAGMATPESLPVAFIVDGRGRIAYIGDPLTLEAPLKRIVAGDWDLSAARRRWDQSRRAESLRQKLEPLLLSGDVAAARSLAFRIVRALNGDDPRILSLVASSIAASPLKADRSLLDIAFEAAARSVSLTRRKAPAMLDGLARIQFLRGDVAGAIETEEAAIALSEGSMQEAEMRTLAQFRAAALHGPR